MKAYVAGPMRGYPEFNFPAFYRATSLLREQGWEVFNPAEHDVESGAVKITDPGYLTGDVEGLPGFDFRAAMRWDTARITEADAIVLLPGWQHSTGAKAERSLAEMLGLDIGYFDGQDGFVWVVEEHPAWPVGHGPTPVQEAEALLKQASPYEDHERHLQAYRDFERSTESDEQLIARHAAEQLIARHAAERRVVDPLTGGAKGSKLARFDLLPYDALNAVAEHFGRGAAKYEDRNWEKGYAWGLSMAAMQRHLAAFWQGDDYDQGDASTGDFPHLAAVAFHALVLLAFWLRGDGTDDRPGR
jgi:hypothetical protein